jgi:hypothetical protein
MAITKHRGQSLSVQINIRFIQFSSRVVWKKEMFYHSSDLASFLKHAVTKVKENRGLKLRDNTASSPCWSEINLSDMHTKFL